MNNFAKTQEVLAEAAVKVDKHKVTMYQLAQHKKGNKISWEQAKEVFVKSAKDLEKEKKRLAAEQKRAEKKAERLKNPPKKGLTAAQFKKMMKDAASDFQADFGDDSPHVLGDIAWDIAGSLMYNPGVDDYVRKVLSKNTGIPPENIDRNRVQEYIADSIHG